MVERTKPTPKTAEAVPDEMMDAHLQAAQFERVRTAQQTEKADDKSGGCDQSANVPLRLSLEDLSRFCKPPISLVGQGGRLILFLLPFSGFCVPEGADRAERRVAGHPGRFDSCCRPCATTPRPPTST